MRLPAKRIPIAALAVVALIAAACGDATNEAATPDTDDEPASDGASADGGELSGTLQIATWSDWDFLQDLADQYMDENENVDIQIDAIPGQEYFDNLPRTLGLDGAPDITILQVTQVGLYRQLVADGLLLDVNDVWENQGLEDATPQPVVDTYTEEDGSRYAVNSGLTFLPVVYYNKGIFDELGLEVPDTERLGSYDELYEIVDTLEGAGHLPMTYNWQEAHHMFQQNVNSSCGNETYEALGTSWKSEEATVSWTDECVVRGIEAYAQLAEDGAFGRDPLMGYDVASAAFTSGASGMFTTGMWAVGQIRDEADFEWGWFMMPPVPDGAEETRWILWLADGLGIAANSQNPELAKDFLEYTMTVEAQSNMPRPPSRTDAEPSTDVDSSLAEMIESLPRLGTAAHFIQGLAPPEFQDVIQSGSEEILLGSKTPEELAQELEDLAASLRDGS